MNSCLFCKIVRKEIPSQIVYETDLVLGFIDANPQAPLHILFVPKKHFNGLADLKKEDGSLIVDLLLSASQVARNHKIEDSGYRLVVNTGKEGGQTVGHLHLHLLGKRMMTWPPG